MKTLAVSISQKLLQAILKGGRILYPRETVLLLRGKKKKSLIKITEFLIPPLATYGKSFATIPFHMLPLDFSIVGMVHSHPSGNLKPSITDLNRSIGIIIMIMGFPYADKRNISAYNRSGEKLMLKVTKA